MYIHILQLVPQSNLLVDVLPSNIFVKATNTSFGVLNDDTWGMMWSLIEYAMILLALTKFFLWVALASSPSSFGTYTLMYWSKSFSSRIREILHFHAWIYHPSSNLVIKLSMVSHIFKWEPQMEILNIQILPIWGVSPSSRDGWPRVY